MMIHYELVTAANESFATLLERVPELHHDAVLLSFANGVRMELRFASAHEYAISWRWGDAELRIDTAPLHRELASFPNHFHDAEGIPKPDLLTRPGDEPWSNVKGVIEAVLADPLLQNA